MNSKLVFLSNFLRNPFEVAAIAPSSKYVIKNMMKHVDFKDVKCIVEYGPGIGTITIPMLRNLNEGAKLLCVESNGKFCEFLKSSIDDSRLIVINDTAENIDYHLERLGIKDVDYVFSGIPFSLIKRKNKETIIKKTKDSLKKGGKFIVYQQYNSHLGKYLKAHFNKVLKKFELRNIPPTAIFMCEKI